MGITDLQLGVLSEAVYSDAEPEDGPAAGFKIFKSQGNDDSGLGASLYIKKAEVCGTTRLIVKAMGLDRSTCTTNTAAPCCREAKVWRFSLFVAQTQVRAPASRAK